MQLFYENLMSVDKRQNFSDLQTFSFLHVGANGDNMCSKIKGKAVLVELRGGENISSHFKPCYGWPSQSST